MTVLLKLHLLPRIVFITTRLTSRVRSSVYRCLVSDTLLSYKVQYQLQLGQHEVTRVSLSVKLAAYALSNNYDNIYCLQARIPTYTMLDFTI